MAALFHLITRADWAAATAVGVLHPPSLDDEGFVHFSYAEQVAGTARRHYAGVRDLVVLELDPDRLPLPIVIEDSYRSGMAFPHLYAEVPVAAVVAVHELDRDADGAFRFSPGDEAAPASPDR